MKIGQKSLKSNERKSISKQSIFREPLVVIFLCKLIGTARAIHSIASQAVSSASLVIAKLGGQAIKIAVK